MIMCIIKLCNYNIQVLDGKPWKWDIKKLESFCTKLHVMTFNC